MPAFLSLQQGAGEASIELPTERRGWLEPAPAAISTTRPLGLARGVELRLAEAPLLVYPAPEAHGPPLPGRRRRSGDRAHASQRRRCPSSAHVSRGDSRRAIAWKPSARRDELLVREYEQQLGADIDLDWRELNACPTNNASAVSPAGSTMPNARAVAIGWCCRGNRRWARRRAVRIACLSARWR
jgi:hypothetical protein